MKVRIVRYCCQNVIINFWRRKSLVIASIVISLLLVICLQYTGHKESTPQFPLGMQSANPKTLFPRRNLSAIAPMPVMKSPSYEGAPNESPPKNRLNLPEETFQKDHHEDPLHREQESFENRKRVDPALRPRYNENNGLVRGQEWNQQASSHFVPPRRIVHFDFKGAPPKVSYLKQVFPIIKAAGATGVLLEYEDMFPFEGSLASVAAGNAYSKRDIKTILKLAKENKLEVIPLVQTFGHLEFVLKLQEFRHIREVDEFPQALCPSRNDSLTLVKEIIDQVMRFHPHVKWLHIGCDEVYHLGYCPVCLKQDRENLFLSHVVHVAEYVKTQHKVTPIVWDDMLRQFSTEKLKEFNIGTLVEPMIWTYVKDVYRFVPFNVWLTFSEVFPNIWAASAFKGAFGETLTVPNVKMHLENNEAWLEVMNEQYKKFNSFNGIIITGWQRYDHLATLCELFPAGFPSLILNLLTVTQGYYSVQVLDKFHEIMKCTNPPKSPVDLEADPYLWDHMSGCYFPGSAIFRMTQVHSEAIKRVDDYIYDVTVHKAWLTSYNVRRNYTSPMRVDEGLAEYSSTMYPLTSLIRNARDALREVYDEYTVAEWIEQNIYPSIVKLETLWKNGMKLKKFKVWEKRPLPPLEDLKKFSVGILEDDASQVQDP